MQWGAKRSRFGSISDWERWGIGRVLRLEKIRNSTAYDYYKVDARRVAYRNRWDFLLLGIALDEDQWLDDNPISFAKYVIEYC